MTSKSAENVIEIRVDEIAQLFHTLDPFPFREKDLDQEAEEYIVGWARELPADWHADVIFTAGYRRQRLKRGHTPPRLQCVPHRIREGRRNQSGPISNSASHEN